MELESYKDGILLYQGAKAGEKILVNDLLCIIGKDGLDVAAIVTGLKAGASAVSTPVVETTPAAPAAPVAVAEQAVVNSGRIFASPLAKRIAAEKGIDLKFVKGSGDNGRITKIDIDQYVPASTVAPAAPVAQSAAPVVSNAVAGQVSFTDVPVSQMRKVIAKRLSESLFTAPHFYLTMQIDMDAAIAARTKINEVSSVKVSFNDLVVKATAMALKKHPKIPMEFQEFQLASVIWIN
jgi:pyruvate dehydrogenase E2 component (dihydrolipoamide acetyltransferase)